MEGGKPKLGVAGDSTSWESHSKVPLQICVGCDATKNCAVKDRNNPLIMGEAAQLCSCCMKGSQMGGQQCTNDHDAAKLRRNILHAIGS
jgi:hypothetical protein